MGQITLDPTQAEPSAPPASRTAGGGLNMESYIQDPALRDALDRARDEARSMFLDPDRAPGPQHAALPDAVFVYRAAHQKGYFSQIPRHQTQIASHEHIPKPDQLSDPVSRKSHGPLDRPQVQHQPASVRQRARAQTVCLPLEHTSSGDVPRASPRVGTVITRSRHSFDDFSRQRRGSGGREVERVE